MFGLRKRRPVAPDQNAVVDRALCLSAVAMLGAIAAGVEDGGMDSGQAGEYLKESHRWLIREQLTAALSIRERALLAKALTDWKARDALNAGWRSEALGVLLWALSAFDEMPPYDTRFERLPSFVPLLAPTADFRRTASLRAAEDIARARDLAELWHWRARTRQLQEADHPQVEGVDLDAVTRQVAEVAHAKGSMPQPIDDDFPAFGKPYRTLDEEQYADLTSAAVERHYALNWLCGYAADWDSVPTET
ncbi:MAG: DUF4272 domain-containing protein [Actinomycetota bacterium]|nr:DUF4272 domain-containing protein [Actinomycetota bacterium]